MERVEYPISPKYVPTWTVVEALRELIANALDTETKITFTWKDGYAHLEDKGNGITRSFWVMGEGDHGKIGQFGEGLKLATLVLAREERDVSVATTSYRVVPSIQHSTTFDSKVLVLTFHEGTRPLGTLVRVACTREEFYEAYDKFLVLRPRPYLNRKLNILDAPGRLYINGVYVQDIDSLWGYDIQDKRLTNRDRSVLDMSKVDAHISNILSKLAKEELIAELLRYVTSDSNRRMVREEGITFRPCSRKWGMVFHKVFGQKACLSSRNTQWDRSVNVYGYEVIQLPYAIHDALSGWVSNAQKIRERIGRKKLTRITVPLTEQEKAVFTQAKAWAKHLVPAAKVTSTSVVDEFPSGGDECHIDGLYKNGKIYLRRSVLQNLATTIGILIHERIHGLGLYDETKDFENVMTDIMGDLSLKLMNTQKLVLDTRTRR